MRDTRSGASELIPPDPQAASRRPCAQLGHQSWFFDTDVVVQAALDPRSDGELLVATVADPEAFAVFYRRHVRGVLSFFRRRSASVEVAFDLTAETFAAALEAVPRYELREEPARGWLSG